MSSMALCPEAVIVGVDTHKAEHYAVALDGLGRRLGQLTLAANPDGYSVLLNWTGLKQGVPAFSIISRTPRALAW